jgi:hypothetical protein
MHSRQGLQKLDTLEKRSKEHGGDVMGERRNMRKE